MNYLKSTKSKYLLQVLLAGIFITVAGISANAQLAAGKSKFLGNVIGTSVPSTFSTYWNQVTPENAGKWATVEATRNVMKWSPAATRDLSSPGPPCSDNTSSLPGRRRQYRVRAT